jgi:enterochelin esterase-like enzyme
MELTSKKVLLLAAIAAVLIFAATVWLWPRLARNNAPAVLGRVVTLLTTQLVMICALLLAVNDSFGFYASWADLFGTVQGQGVVVMQGNTSRSRQLQVLGHQSVNVSGGSVPSVGGRIEKIQITGRHSHITTPAYIYLPPEYFKPQYSKRAFPTAVVLTGYPGTSEHLITGLKYPAVAHRQAASGAAQPTILVMLRPTVAPPRDTECVDVPHGPQTETFFAKDLPAAIATHYRVGHHARNWGVIGDSTGGYCALKLAMRHPETFGAAASLSGYYKAPIDPTTGALFGGSAKLARESDLMWRLAHLPHPPVSLLVTSSKHGEKNYNDTLAFIRAATPPTQTASVLLSTGGHNFNTWAREVPPALQWLCSRLSDR